MPKVVVYGAMDPAGHAVLDARKGVTSVRVGPSETAKLMDELADADAVVLRYVPFDAAAVARAKSCKVLSRSGVGFDNIDMAAANAAGIPVAVTGDVNSRAVAEHALALMLGAAKQLLRYDTATRHGDWAAREHLDAIELDGKAVLVVGFGRIGRRTAELCTAFGMTVSVYDPFMPAERIAGAGHRCVTDLDAAIPDADFITLHIPGGADNANLIDRHRIAAMKPEAVIVNTARGQLIDEAALAEALAAGRIHGAGADVFSGEPPRADNPMFAAGRCILTPHTAGLTRECMRRVSIVAARNALAAIDGRLDPALVVNRGEVKL